MERIRNHRRPTNNIVANIIVTLFIPGAYYQGDILANGSIRTKIKTLESINISQHINPLLSNFYYYASLFDLRAYYTNLKFRVSLSLGKEASYVGLGCLEQNRGSFWTELVRFSTRPIAHLSAIKHCFKKIANAISKLILASIECEILK